MNRKALLESAKELARVAVFGAVSAALAWATTKVGNLDPNSAYAVAGTLVLRIADKYVHASPAPAKGLLPF